MALPCPDTTCAIYVNARCSFYESSYLPYTGIATNDSLQTSLQKIELAIKNIIDDGGGGGSAIWGGITGTLTNQIDLTTYLSNTYVPQSRTITINGVVFDLSANRSWSVVGSISPGTGISVGGIAEIPIITNTAPDQTVAFTNGTGISVTGTYPNFTITNTAPSSGGTVTSVSGTTNRITSTGGVTPVIDVAATYVGQSSITTLGTISTGVWNGTDIAFANIAQGSARSVLGVTGNATADLAPIQGSANQLLRVNGAGTALAFGSIDLGQSATVGSSILAVANGGTNLSTIPALSVLVTNTLDTLTTITPGAGQSIRVNAGNTAWEAYTPSAATIGGSIAATQIGYGSGANTLTSESAFTYTAATNTLTVDNIESNAGIALSILSNDNLDLASNVDVNITSIGNTFILSNGGIDLTAATTIRLLTAATSRLQINSNGSWTINATTGSSGQALVSNGAGSTPTWQTIGGSIGGSTGALDNAILRADGTGGSTLQSSTTTVDDSGNMVINASTALVSSDNTSLRIDLTSTGTSANGFGSAIILRADNDAGTQKTIGVFSITYTDVTNGSEDSRLDIAGISAGVSSTFLSATSGGLQLGNSTSASTTKLISVDSTSSDVTLNIAAKGNGNLGLLTTAGSFGSGTKVIFIPNATTAATTSPIDGIILHGKDSSDGAANATLALYLEQAVEAIGTFTASHKIKVWINNVEYWIQLDAV